MQRNKILTIIATLSLCCTVQAQSARELIEQDPSRIGNQLHHYEVPEWQDTKAPAGYKPFYVSHFGRHGSRYHTNDNAYRGTLKVLRAMDGQDLLTAAGKEILADLEVLDGYHQGMGGYLTQVGSREHQGVATRLYLRCPQIFRQKGRNEVLAVSSTVVRCNQSMMNFCTALKGKAPGLEISYYTNGRTDAALTRVAGGDPIEDRVDNSKEVLDSIRNARMDITRICGMMFTDSTRAAKLAKKEDLKALVYSIIDLGTIEQCLDEECPQIYRHFTTDELFNYWVARNATTLNAHGFSYENREVLRRCGKLIVKDMLEKADEAMAEGSRKAADFRFSHDGGVLPLIFFLGLEGNDETWHLGTEWEHGWYGFENIPMCTNVQMIFYRNRKGDVLVKLLHNERETTITRLEPSFGPYYDWKTLREYLVMLSEVDC